MKRPYAYYIKIDLTVDKHIHNMALVIQLVVEFTVYMKNYGSLNSRKCAFEYFFK